MSNHQEIPEDIRKQIKDFEGKLNLLPSLIGKAKEQALLKQDKQLKRIKRLLNTYQISIQSGAFQDTVATHKSQYKEFEKTLAQLDKSLETCRQDVGTQEDLFRHKPKTSRQVEMKEVNNRQMVIEAGDRAQKQSEEALKRIQQHIGRMDEQANDILTELDRQINKLDQIYDEMNDTETTLARAEKHLRYFGRQVYADRCLICIIIIIAVAIIVIIGLAIAGKTPKQMNNQVA